MVEEEYKQVTRDHDIALEFYNSLLKKMDESSMATALEHRQEGEQFRVMDPANLPDAPSFPSRPKFAGAGLAGGLALGFLLAALLEYRDTTLRTELDVWAFTKLPTLAVLSHIDGLPKNANDQDGGKSFARIEIFRRKVWVTSHVREELWSSRLAISAPARIPAFCACFPRFARRWRRCNTALHPAGALS